MNTGFVLAHPCEKRAIFKIMVSFNRNFAPCMKSAILKIIMACSANQEKRAILKHGTNGSFVCTVCDECHAKSRTF